MNAKNSTSVRQLGPVVAFQSDALTTELSPPLVCLLLGSGNGSVVRASYSWSKDPGFESPQERRDFFFLFSFLFFFLQGQLSEQYSRQQKTLGSRGWGWGLIWVSSVLRTALEGNGATEGVVGGWRWGGGRGGVVRVNMFYSRHLERMGSLGWGRGLGEQCCTHGTWGQWGHRWCPPDTFLCAGYSPPALVAL